jgi:serine/threonine protein kinase
MPLTEKYDILQKISEGTFGKVYKGKNKKTNELVAIKIENRSEINTLKTEAKIYQYLGKQHGFPQLKWFETNTNYNILVIDYLGESLSQIINNFGKMSLDIVLKIGTQIITRLKLLHSKQMIHRDIKPQNIVMGYKDKSVVYLIDFTFAKRFLVNETHIKERVTNKLIGSPNFVSLNIHKRIEPSRRDDIISSIYVLMYLYFGKLEWEDCNNEDSIIELKMQASISTNIPQIFRNLLVYCSNLSFVEEPNYEYIISTMLNDSTVLNVSTVLNDSTVLNVSTI